MKHNPNMNAASARPSRKITGIAALALFLFATSPLGCAAATVAPTIAPHYPAITIFVGSG